MQSTRMLSVIAILAVLCTSARTASARVFFEAGQTYAVGDTATSVLIFDCGTDGIPDMVYNDVTLGRISVRQGAGDGTFGAPVNYTTDGNPGNLAAADMNGDGIRDIIAGGDALHFLAGVGDGTFAADVTFPTGLGGNYAVVADFNGDGHADVASALFGASSIAVLLGDGAGSFAPTAYYPLAGQPVTIGVNDFNGDGHQDLYVPIVGSDGASVLLNTGNGTFGAAANFPAGTTPNAAVAADFDRDGFVDMALTNRMSGDISLLFGNGDGTFQPTQTIDYGGDNPVYLALCDYNKDGLADLTVLDTADHTATILEGDGNGAFPQSTAVPVPSGPHSCFVGDFDRDGGDDLAVVTVYDKFISVLLRQFTPTHASFDTPVTLSTGSPLSAAAAADLDNDGDLDIAVTNVFANNISLFFSNGDGTYSAPLTYMTDSLPSDIIAEDFNRDGWVDLAVLNAGSDTISIMPGTGGGNFGPSSPYVNFGPRTMTAGDLNGDGALDLAIVHSGTVSVRLGDGLGSFGPSTGYAAHASARFVLAEDFDLDGDLDLAVAERTQNNVRIMLNIGDGSFDAGTLYPVGAADPYTLATGDFDQDGIPDLVSANWGTYSVSFLKGLGNGTFDSPRIVANLAEAKAVVSGDFNQDGRLDLAVSCNSGLNYVLAGNGAGEFGTPRLIASITGAEECLSADFDGNGLPDLAFPETNGARLSILLNSQIQRNAAFSDPISLGATVAPSESVSADFNHDGLPDFASISGGVASRVEIFMHNANGAFLNTTTFTFGLGTDFIEIAAADLNRDGDVDLLITDRGQSQVIVLMGDGTGMFTSASPGFPVPSGPIDSVVLDFNRDGIADIITVGNIVTPNLAVLPGVGDGTFGPAQVGVPLVSPTSVASADFNRDGAPDLVIGTNTPAGSVAVHLGNGAGGFQSASVVPVSIGVDALEAGRFNADGFPDIAVISEAANQALVCFGDGLGGFSAGDTYSLAGGASSLSLGDFNADGQRDLAIGRSAAQSVEILTGSTSGTFTSIGAYVAGGAPGTPLPVDLDRDGRTDLLVAVPATGALNLLRNVGGQFKLETTDVAPTAMTESTSASLLKIVATNNGHPDDAATRLTALELEFRDGLDQPLDAPRFANLVGSISIWWDADDSGAWEPGSDVRIANSTYLLLDYAGRVSLPIAQTNDALVNPGTQKTFFVVIETPGMLGSETLKIAHITSASSKGLGEHSGANLLLQSTPDVSSSGVVLPVEISAFSID
jgi:hypothetical protein